MAAQCAGGLPPRLARTLEQLLDGRSEKETARRLRVSPHTAHKYVKDIYKHFGVHSRAELNAMSVKFQTGKR